MLGTLKITQGNKKKYVWKNVPLQDFTSASDIDWNWTGENAIIYTLSPEQLKIARDGDPSLPEAARGDSPTIRFIDQQLYNKYKLTPEEINFIETRVKPMGDK